MEKEVQKFVAHWKSKWVYGEDLIACSRSEEDELFDVGDWEYPEIPEKYTRYNGSNPDAVVVGIKDGEESILRRLFLKERIWCVDNAFNIFRMDSCPWPEDQSNEAIDQYFREIGWSGHGLIGEPLSVIAKFLSKEEAEEWLEENIESLLA